MSSYFKKGPNLSFSSEEYQIRCDKIIKKKIILAGLSGSGKSSVAKALCGNASSITADGKVAMTFTSVTKNVVVSEGNKISFQDREYVLDIFDTVGFGDGGAGVTFATILRQITERLPRDLNEINKVVFCFRLDRLRSQLAEELKSAYSFFKLLGGKPENFLVCITFTDFYNEATIQQFVNGMVSTPEFDWIQKDNIAITYLSFPNLSELVSDEEVKSLTGKLIGQSSYRLMKNIVASTEEKFFPHQVLTQLDKTKITAFAKMLEQDQKRPSFWVYLLNSQAKDVSYSKVIEEMCRMKGLPSEDHKEGGEGEAEGKAQLNVMNGSEQKSGAPGGSQ